MLSDEDPIPGGSARDRISGSRPTPAKIKIAFRNLFINAVEAIRGRGEIEVRLVAEDGRLRLTVKDTGVGMDKSVLDRIFDTYFSTKDAGTGLGLPIARKIIEDHGGTIRAESVPAGDEDHDHAAQEKRLAGFRRLPQFEKPPRLRGSTKAIRPPPSRTGGSPE